MSKFSRHLALILALVLALSIGSISLAEEDAPVKKITFQMSTEPQCMDPTMNDYSTGSYALQNLFRGLYKFDKAGNIVPGDAESYDVSEDGMTYTFHLRKDLMWSDGTPLTAADYAYSWKRVLDPQFSSETAYTLYAVIKDGYACFVEGTVAPDALPIVAVDDTTLEVTLTAPAPYFISMTASTAYMPVKKEIIEQYGEDWETNAESFVCNGPFMISEMKHDEKYVLVKNPYYYDADTIQIDEVDMIFLDAAETVLIAFDNGEIDIATSLSADAEKKYANTDNLLYSDRIGFRYYEFNCESAVVSDARVRKALAMALDRKTLITAILQSDMPALCGFIPHAFPDLVEADKSWREVHGDSFVEDVDAAKALLAEAGYPDGAGLPTIRLVQTPDAMLVKVAQAMAQMWKQNLGVETEIVTVESGVYWADDTGTRDAGDFDIAYMGYTGDYLDPSSVLLNFASEDSPATRWKNEEYDELMAQARSGVAGAEREALFERAEAVLSEEFPVLPIYSYVSTALISSRVTGFTRNYIGHPYFEFCDIVE